MTNPRLLFVALLLAGSAATVPGHAASQQSGAPAVFEMRTYTTHPGRLDELHRRFRDHTVALFERHGIVNVGYWIPRDSARADNTLVYMLAYPSRDARDTMWRAFLADPDWQAARAASEADGPIVANIESVFLDPADYSPMR